MIELRRVNVYTTTCGGKKSFIGVGVFHQFGVDYEEFEAGPGQYTTAIVEMDDGVVKSVPANMITFKVPLK